MAHCGPLGGASFAAVEVENMDKTAVAVELECSFGENPATSDGEKYDVSPDDEHILSKAAPDHEDLRTYYFGSSSIIVSIIKEMLEKGYFMEDEAHALGAETMLEPNNDEIVVYKYFFVTSLRKPLHPGATASADTQHHCTIVKIFLGHRQLRWCALGEFFCKVQRAPLTAKDC
jgi:hypothetical protein